MIYNISTVHDYVYQLCRTHLTIARVHQNYHHRSISLQKNQDVNIIIKCNSNNSYGFNVDNSWTKSITTAISIHETKT
jgi:hypothetical protein